MSEYQAERGFITLAFGNADYLRMAQALLASYRRFQEATPFAVVTDKPNDRRLRDFDVIIRHRAEFGAGVEQKLALNVYSPFNQTLFVDSDCLFYKKPSILWDLYTPKTGFVVKGFSYKYHEDKLYSVDNLDFLLKNLSINKIANINGGIYFFNKSDIADRVFEIARSLAVRAEELGLISMKYSRLNDEIAISAAMELCGIEAQSWDQGQAMDMTFQMDGDHEIDINKPSARFRVHGRCVDPVVIHFNVGAQYSILYLTEARKILLRNSKLARVAPAIALLDRTNKVFRRKFRRFEERFLYRFRYGLPSG